MSNILLFFFAFSKSYYFSSLSLIIPFFFSTFLYIHIFVHFACNLFRYTSEMGRTSGAMRRRRNYMNRKTKWNNGNNNERCNYYKK